MTERRRAQIRAANRRYRLTAKGRAAQRRYRLTPKARATDARGNARLLRAGRTYLGKAATPEQGRVLNAHIKEMVIGFKAGQRAEASEHTSLCRPQQSIISKEDACHSVAIREQRKS